MSSITRPGDVIGATARFAIALLVGALLMVGTAGSAQAKHSHRHWHAHHHAPAMTAHLVAPEPCTLGPMRYYGGPKSPMWRGPAVTTQMVAQAPSHLGPMRYYGGPKSPMWRSPAAN